ncbi:hypothetical protein AB6D60_22460 [Vibrio splendidus]
MNIAIVGPTGSGKSTLASILANKKHITHLELDSYYWLPEWKERSEKDFIKIVEDKISIDGWVTCGNYVSVRNEIWGKSDYIIWLNYPFRVVLWRSIKRVCLRVILKSKFCNGNTQTARELFSRDSIILWLFKTYKKRQLEYKRLLSDPSITASVIEVNSPTELSLKLEQI